MKRRFKPAPVGRNFLRLSPAGPDGTTVVCFPAAGAGANRFRSWLSAASGDVSLLAVRTGGREDRLRDPAPDDLPRLVGELADEFSDALPDDADVVFFGSCLGAILAFEVARELRRQGRRPVRRLKVAGDAPSSPPPAPVEDVRAEMVRTGGLSEVALAEPDVFALFEKTLRADFALASRYRYSRENPLPVPIDLFVAATAGTAETDAMVEGWSRETSAGLDVIVVDSVDLNPTSTSGRLAEQVLLGAAPAA